MPLDQQSPGNNIPHDPLSDDQILSNTMSSSPQVDISTIGQVANDESILDSILATQEPTGVVTQQEKKPIEGLLEVIGLSIKNHFDYIRIEPNTSDVEVICIKEEKEVERFQIKFPIYNVILLKAKTSTALDITQTKQVQEGKSSFSFENSPIELQVKVVPSENGEKLWMKVKPLAGVLKKERKKIPLSKILGFLGAALFVALVIGGTFITFIVLNAKTAEDVKFFSSLGISLNDINTFIIKIVTIIFSALLFLETVLLSIVLFKFILTKKEYKRKKMIFGILSAVMLMISFGTGTAWLIIDKKVRSLPNWQEVAYGDVKILDNDKLVSEKFSVGDALITDTSKLIGPVTLKYDLTLFAKRETDKGYQIKKYLWDFGDGKIIEELNPVIIQKFTKKGTFNVSLKVLEIDLIGKTVEKNVEDVKEISIINVVQVEEKKLSNGGIQASFDATSLKDLGKIEWYFEDNLNTPIAKGEIFRPAKIFYEETLVGMRIIKDGEANTTFDKVFVIAGTDGSSISGEINAEQSIENDLSYTLSVKNIKNDFQDGFVEEFKWIIGDKEYLKKGDVTNLEASSIIKHEFLTYGKQEIKVILKDANGNTKEISQQINITKILKLKNSLFITSNGNPLESIRYEAKAKEYFINDLGSPTRLKLDARQVRADGFIYSLAEEDIVWDFDGDSQKDTVGRVVEYEVNTPGNTTLSVTYTFKHRKIVDDIVVIKEKIYIEAVKREAILDLKIEPQSLYIPTFVRFDASRSEVKDDDIIKFIYDYGDGFKEERDAINPGRQYLKEGEYIVKLKVITKKGKEYSLSKSLVLKAKPDIAQIGMSMKQAPVGQEIDFNSEGSDGQVISYFWNFGDGASSTEANPSHAYKKLGTYKVTLRIGYKNSNYLEDEVEIDIIEE